MQTGGAVMRPMGGSFALHACLSLTVYFVPLWWILTFALLVYKATRLPFTDAALGIEITVSVLMWLMQVWAVKLGKRGNLTEQTATLGVGVVLMVFVIGGSCYYAWGQTYVMRIDRGFSVTLLILNALNLLLSVFAIQGFGGSAPSAIPASNNNDVPPPPGAQPAVMDQQAQQQLQAQQMQQLAHLQQQQQEALMNAGVQGQQQQQQPQQQQQQFQQSSSVQGDAVAGGGGGTAEGDAEQQAIQQQLMLQQQWAAQQQAAAGAQ